MTARFEITYSVVTEESAQEGCSAEHGWWMPGGWEYPLEDSAGCHEQVLDEAKSGQFGLSLRDFVKSAKDLGALCEIQAWRGSLSACSVDPPCDRANLEQGESRYYTIHVSGCSEGTIARIRRLLEY